MKKMSMIALLLVAVLVTSYSVSGTYAKYTSEFTGSTDTARVAKWAFSINNTDMTTANNEFKFDLFKTVNDELNPTVAETDVKVGNQQTDEVIIAPGTTGSFKIALVNNSEVNAEYTVDYTVTNTANIPVEFSIDGTNWTTSLADVAATGIGMNGNGSEDEINIQWRWTYDSEDRTSSTGVDTTLADSTDDEYDTALGVKTTADTISVKAVINVTQVD